MKFEGSFDKKLKKLNIIPTISISNESLLLNGELYNNFELMKIHKISNDSKTSAEVFLKLLSKKGFESLNLMNAEYSIAYIKEDSLFLLRDLFGTKPLFYKDSAECFEFSDKESKDYTELAPAALLKLDIKDESIKIFERSFLEKQKPFDNYNEGVEEFAKQLFRSVSSRVYNLYNFAVFDNETPESSIIIRICKDLGCDFLVFKGSFDKACEQAGSEGCSFLVTSFGFSKILNNDLSFDLKS